MSIIISDRLPIQDPLLVTGTITALNQTVQMKINGYKSHAIVLTGTWTGAVVCETSSDNGATWCESSVHKTASGPLTLGILTPLILREITSNNTYKTNSTGGNTHFRVRGSTAITGTINVSLVETDAPHITHFGQNSINQSTAISINNSSTTNINVGGIFTGLSDSAYGISGIEVNIISDQPLYISIQQSMDNINWDISDIYLTFSNSGDSRVFKTTSSYFRIVVYNVGLANTTYFRLQTILCPIVEVLPRALTPEGNLKVAIKEPVGGDGRVRVGQESLVFFDSIDGTTIDLVGRWLQSQSNMTQSQTNGNLTLNANSTLTSGSYSILTSIKQMLILNDFSIRAQFKVKMTHVLNSVVEFGFGNVSGTSAPTDGAFMRVDNFGNIKGVINFAGSETITNTAGFLNDGYFYSIDITITDSSVKFGIKGIDINIDSELIIPSGQASPISVGHLPIFLRVYNSSTTSSAAQIILGNVSVQQMDLNTNKPWSEQISGIGKSAILNPTTFSQSCNYTNNTVAALATLSNTAAGYTTLGGLFRFAAVASSETDYALFAYQVPIGFQLYVWSITITAFITGANSATNPTILQWAIGADSSAVSLATGAPNSPIFLPIGMQQATKTSIIGDTFNPATITFAPKTPIIINSNRFFHVVLRIPLSNATASQVIRGSVTIEGYFE